MKDLLNLKDEDIFMINRKKLSESNHLVKPGDTGLIIERIFIKDTYLISFHTYRSLSKAPVSL